MRRRTALKVLASGMAAATTVAVGGPALLNAGASTRSRRAGNPSWQRVGPIEEFAAGYVTLVTLPDSEKTDFPGRLAKGLYVSRSTDGQIIVFSRVCTDLGCPITYDAGSGWFYCPCHGGVFDELGMPRAGPPSHPLWRYASRVEQGVLEIDVQSVPAHV